MNRGIKALVIIVAILAVLAIAGYFAWPVISSQLGVAPANTNANVVSNANANANANRNVAQPGGTYSESTSNLPGRSSANTNANENEPANKNVEPTTNETSRPDMSQYAEGNITRNPDGSVRTVATDPATDLDKEQMKQAVRDFMPNYFTFMDQMARKQYLTEHLDLGYISKNHDKNTFRWDVDSDYRESLFVNKDWMDITWSEPIAMSNYSGGAYCQVNIDHTYVNPGDDGAPPTSHRVSDCYYVYLNDNYKITDMKRITTTEL